MTSLSVASVLLLSQAVSVTPWDGWELWPTEITIVVQESMGEPMRIVLGRAMEGEAFVSAQWSIERVGDEWVFYSSGSEVGMLPLNFWRQSPYVLGTSLLSVEAARTDYARPDVCWGPWIIGFGCGFAFDLLIGGIMVPFRLMFFRQGLGKVGEE